jgi:hypothetical protein
MNGEDRWENSKLEARNPKQIQNPKHECAALGAKLAPLLNIRALNLFRASDFEFRALNFWGAAYRAARPVASPGWNFVRPASERLPLDFGQPLG